MTPLKGLLGIGLNLVVVVYYFLFSATGQFDPSVLTTSCSERERDDSAAITLIFAAILLRGGCDGFLFIAGQLYVDDEADERMRGAAQGFIAFILWGLGAFGLADVLDLHKLACFSRAMALASARKRARSCAPAGPPARIIFSATTRLRLAGRAL